MIRTKFVKAGDWRTIEWFWNVKATLFFAGPAGAWVKVRYGDGWPFGWDSQKQMLDGRQYKRLVVGFASAAYARVQMRVAADMPIGFKYRDFMLLV